MIAILVLVYVFANLLFMAFGVEPVMGDIDEGVAVKHIFCGIVFLPATLIMVVIIILIWAVLYLKEKLSNKTISKIWNKKIFK